MGNADDTIVGRSKTLVEVALREHCVVTSGLEEWGGLIRAWVPNENGGTSMQFFDADTAASIARTQLTPGSLKADQTPPAPIFRSGE